MRDCEALNRGESYYNLKELYIIFLCPDDIFAKGRAVYRFKNLETDNPKIEMGDLTFKNFYIFNKYREVAEKAVRDYMEYFATNKANTPATENIDRLVKWYQTDSNTRIRYMTWQEEIDIAVDLERQRADDAENRLMKEAQRADEAEKKANKAKSRADEAEKLASEAESRADEAEARANKYEQMLRELGKL